MQKLLLLLEVSQVQEQSRLRQIIAVIVRACFPPSAISSEYFMIQVLVVSLITMISKHFKKHTLPVHCRVLDCTRRFEDNPHMERHVSEAHPAQSTRTRHFCILSDCDYHKSGSKLGFSRHESLTRHLKSRHPFINTDDLEEKRKHHRKS